jgi:hypothetical protein
MNLNHGDHLILKSGLVGRYDSDSDRIQILYRFYGKQLKRLNNHDQDFPPGYIIVQMEVLRILSECEFVEENFEKLL